MDVSPGAVELGRRLAWRTESAANTSLSGDFSGAEHQTELAEMKRANGTGSISKMPGKRCKPYIARISVYDEDQILRQKSIGTFATQREAQAALAEFVKEPGAVQRKLDGRHTTIGDVYSAWQVKAFEGLTAQGKGNYTVPWKRRLEAHKDRVFSSMGVDDWQAIADEDAAAGLSEGSVQKLITLIKALNRYASMRDIIVKDYSQFLEMPPIIAVKAEKGALTPEQVERIKAAATDGDIFAQSALVLCYTGFRVNEFLSLKPEHYHPEPVPHFVHGSKTAAGKGRQVPVHPIIQPYIDSWLARNGRAMFCQENGKGYVTSNYRDGHFAPLMESLGMPGVTPHWCRYTFETAMKRAGVEPSLIDSIVGHAPKTMGDHYTDWTLQDKAGAVAKLP